jgi:hypothetical protein
VAQARPQRACDARWSRRHSPPRRVDLPQTDLRFVLGKAPLLLDEMMKIAILPRPPYGYGWMVGFAAPYSRTAVVPP